jgi:hypothetical protein
METSYASRQNGTAPPTIVPVSQQEELYSARAWQIYQDALALRSTPYGLSPDFVAQYPSLAIETLGGLSELAPHPSNGLTAGKIFIDSKTAATTLLVYDIQASWQFYHRVFPQAWFKRDVDQWFSMLFAKDKEVWAKTSTGLDFTEITVEAIFDPDQGRVGHVRSECTRMDIAVKLVSRDTLEFATLCPFLYSDPVFPEITRISDALLRCPEWRADHTMEMKARDVSWPGGRRLDFTDLDGYRWRMMEEEKNRYRW